MFDPERLPWPHCAGIALLNTSPPRMQSRIPTARGLKPPTAPSYLEIRNSDTFRFVSNDTVRYQSQTIVGGLGPSSPAHRSTC